MSIASGQSQTSIAAYSPAGAMKRKFALALALIDFGLCLAIFALFPNQRTWGIRAGYEYWDRVASPYHWEILLPLFLAVILVTIGIYWIVDTFYPWPSKSQ